MSNAKVGRVIDAFSESGKGIVEIKWGTAAFPYKSANACRSTFKSCIPSCKPQLKVVVRKDRVYLINTLIVKKEDKPWKANT